MQADRQAGAQGAGAQGNARTPARPPARMVIHLRPLFEIVLEPNLT
jgi:hypothetical protein